MNVIRQDVDALNAVLKVEIAPGDYQGKVKSSLEKYRKTVNPKVNVFSVQVAGYDNMVLPENLYRGALLAGWTGKEPIYAKSIIDTWDSVELVSQ